jgi:hypothetical protein
MPIFFEFPCEYNYILDRCSKTKPHRSNSPFNFFIPKRLAEFTDFSPKQAVHTMVITKLIAVLALEKRWGRPAIFFDWVSDTE